MVRTSRYSITALIKQQGIDSEGGQQLKEGFTQASATSRICTLVRYTEQQVGAQLNQKNDTKDV